MRYPNLKCGRRILDIEEMPPGETVLEISEDCRWGIRTKFKQGVMHLNANHFLGYHSERAGHIAYPVTRQFRQELYDVIVEVFNSVMEQAE